MSASMKTLMLASAIALIGSPVFAQTATRYYIVQDVATKKCEIVQAKPKAGDDKVTQIGEDYETEDAAGRAVKLVKQCGM
jgi:hypothetical protein